MNKPVIIFCATALGKSVLDIFKSNQVVVYGFLDDDKKLHDTEIEEVTVLGATDDASFLKIIGKDCDAFIASDDNKWKASMIRSLREEREAMPVNAIHSTAQISPSAVLHHGSLIAQGVRIGANAKVGNHCILHAGAIIDFDATIGDFVQIGAGSIINSAVVIEDGAFVGSGATIVSGVTIGQNARVGAGSVVIGEVGKKSTVFGNPAQKVK
ncbi:MAG: acetyltransferase [Cyclobacteriaceae bacterium]|nr:acetyltransferase [Cyclobacteriaceae bacterium]